MSKYPKALPHTDWNGALVRKKALPYQGTWFRVWKSAVILGTAFVTIVISIA